MPRGRKPKGDKNYFKDREEQAIIKYIASNSASERDKIFREVLMPAFEKMIPSIIRRYKLYVPDEEFDTTFNDTISYLLTKIGNFKPNITIYEAIEDDEVTEAIKEEAIRVKDDEFKEYLHNVDDESPKYIRVSILTKSKETINVYYEKVEKHYKAYSYCGTVCKNYLIYKNMQFIKYQERNTSYDTVSDVFESNEKYSTGPNDVFEELAQKLIPQTAREIKGMVISADTFHLNDNEIKVGRALSNLLENWEEILIDDSSNKLQKSAVLYYLREETMMTTKEVRDNMKPFKNLYFLLKKTDL